MGIANYKIIKDYILGKSSSVNLSKLLDWMNESDKNEEILFRAEKMYHEGRQSFRPSEADIDLAEADIMSRIMQYEGEPHTKTHHMSFLRYAAAALALVACGAIAIWSLAHMDGDEMVSITAMEKEELMLPDGSTVWLNKNSTIRYAKNFADDTRKVELSGEALFQVVKNPDKPFIVSSGSVSAKVLGTVFDFNTRCDGNKEEVTLLEGRLEVSDNIGNNKVTINPDQKIIIDKTNKTVEVKAVYAPADAVWHDGMIPFKRMSVGEIADVLEQIYGVDIMLGSSIDRGQTYSGAVPYNDDIDIVLRNLSNTIPIKYSRHGKAVTITGK